jgi:hypothetical protein
MQIFRGNANFIYYYDSVMYTILVSKLVRRVLVALITILGSGHIHIWVLWIYVLFPAILVTTFHFRSGEP